MGGVDAMLRDDLGALLPPLCSQEASAEDAIVYVHFFNPCGVGDWWITEGSAEGDDFSCSASAI